MLAIIVIIVIVMMMLIRVAPVNFTWKPLVSPKERKTLNEKVIHGTENYWSWNY